MDSLNPALLPDEPDANRAGVTAIETRDRRSAARRLAEGILGYPAQHIAWRIIGPFALLTLVFAATGTYLTTSIVGGSLRERFDNRLLEAGRAAADSLVLQERKHLEVARAAAFTNGVAAATRAGDAQTLANLTAPIAANGNIDQLAVVDASGSVVYRTAHSPDSGRYESGGAADLAGVEFLSRALKGQEDAAGDKFSGLLNIDSQYNIGTAAPVYDGDSIVGAVLVATRLDSLLPAMKTNAFADVTLYAGGQPIASTFTGGGLSEEANLEVQEAVTGREGDGVLKETRELFGRDYTLLYADFKLRGQDIGLYSVALSNDFVTSAGSTAAWQMALLFGGGTVVVFAIGWLVSRSLTEPLFQLLRTARRVTRGDLTARSGLVKSDEIGALAGAFDAMTQKLQQQHLATVRALTSAIDARDPYTLGHSVRVAQLAVELGRQISLPKPLLQHLEIGGYLHDIGKIGIRDAVLLKPGALTAAQRTIIEDHPLIGLRILEAVELAPEIIEFVGGHHERLNGSGYPLGLRDDEISTIPRIGAVADIYDALTTNRPYRAAMTSVEAMGLLRREADAGLLDPVIVGAMSTIATLWEERRRDDPSLQGFRLLELAAA